MRVRLFYGIFRFLFLSLIYTVVSYSVAFPLIPKAESAETVDRIVAIINDDIITLSELNQAIKPYTDRIMELGYSLENQRKMLFKVREEVLGQLIDKKLTDQEVERYKISVSEKEIDSTIERIKEARFLTDEGLRESLARDGFTLEEFREKMKEQILRRRLVTIEIQSKIVITKEDIKAYYERNVDQYSVETKYRLSNILMKVSPNSGVPNKLEVKKKMEGILVKLKEGQPFATLANSYSESSSTTDGGDLGLFSLSMLSPQLQEAMGGMKVGEFTPVLDTDQGYQIFYISEIVKMPGKSLEESSPEIETKLYNEIVDNKFAAWIEDLRKRSHIKIIQ